VLWLFFHRVCERGALFHFLLSLLQDGTQVQLKSALRKTYITADQGGGGAVVASKTQASSWETFKVEQRSLLVVDE
jgi:hypothetical protein